MLEDINPVAVLIGCAAGVAVAMWFSLWLDRRERRTVREAAEAKQRDDEYLRWLDRDFEDVD